MGGGVRRQGQHERIDGLQQFGPIEFDGSPDLGQGQQRRQQLSDDQLGRN